MLALIAGFPLAAFFLLDPAPPAAPPAPQTIVVHGHRGVGTRGRCICVYERYQVPCGMDQRETVDPPEPNEFAGPCFFEVIVPRGGGEHP